MTFVQERLLLRPLNIRLVPLCELVERGFIRSNGHSSIEWAFIVRMGIHRSNGHSSIEWEFIGRMGMHRENGHA